MNIVIALNNFWPVHFIGIAYNMQQQQFCNHKKLHFSFCSFCSYSILLSILQTYQDFWFVSPFCRIYGCKGIGVREGELSLHGRPIVNTWTRLATTAEAGATQWVTF